MEQAILEYLREFGGLKDEQLLKLGFDPKRSLRERILHFEKLQKVCEKSVKEMATLTQAEAESYAQGKKATYWAESAMVTVFTDSTERSPTFRSEIVSVKNY